MSRNIIFYTAAIDGPLWGVPEGGRASFWRPRQFKNVHLDHNLYVDATSELNSGGIFGSGKPFPGNLSFAEWRTAGHDEHSAAAVHRSDDWSWEAFRDATSPQAAALGIQPLQVDDAGPDDRPYSHRPPPPTTTRLKTTDQNGSTQAQAQRFVLLAPDMFICPRGAPPGDCQPGAVNEVSTTLLPGLQKLGVTDFAVASSMLSPWIANGSRTTWADANPPFDSNCTFRNGSTCDPLASTECMECEWPGLFAAINVAALPQMYMFDTCPYSNMCELGGISPPFRCPQFPDAHCPDSTHPSASERAPGGFDWWDDELWEGIEATFASAAAFTCSTGSRTLTLEQEGYFGYLRCPNASAVTPWGVSCAMYFGNHSNGAPPPFTNILPYYAGVIGGWNFLPNASLTHDDRRRKVVERGRQVARAAATACPGISIAIYNPYQDLSALGWMAGLATPEAGGSGDSSALNVSKVMLWSANYVSASSSLLAFSKVSKY